MIADHIHDALAQVRTLKELILDRGLFKGYSGKARIVCGGFSILGATLLASPLVPRTVEAHLVGWIAILALSLVANYAAILYWFLFDPDVRRDFRQLKPALDAVPALAVGAFLSVAVVRVQQVDLLFGVWMCLYGLSQVAYRQSLPRQIYWIGIFYLVAGVAWLLWPGAAFLNPWPMGITFFLGEWAGGIVLLTDERLRQS